MTLSDSAVMALGIERDEAKDRVRVLEGSAAHLAGQVLDLEERNAELQKDLDEAYLTAASARVRCGELEAMKARLETWATELEAKRNQPGDVGQFIAAELRTRMRGEP